MVEDAIELAGVGYGKVGELGQLCCVCGIRRIVASKEVELLRSALGKEEAQILQRLHAHEQVEKLHMSGGLIGLGRWCMAREDKRLEERPI